MLALTRISRLRKLVGLLPVLGKLGWRLLNDERVPKRHRAMLVVAAAYVATPFDMAPDPLPAIGRIDDLLVVAASLAWMLKFAPRDVLDEHLADMGLSRGDLETTLADISGSLLGRGLLPRRAPSP